VVDEEQRLPLVCAAALKHTRVVELLLPVTSRLEGVGEWSVEGLVAHAEEQLAKAREGGRPGRARGAAQCCAGLGQCAA
jgi:hypothetical protein